MVIRSARTIEELKQYIRDDRGQTHGSPHDDAVMSLALANHGRPFVYADEYLPDEVGAVRGSFDWWAERMRETPRSSGLRIGADNVRQDWEQWAA